MDREREWKERESGEKGLREKERGRKRKKEKRREEFVAVLAYKVLAAAARLAGEKSGFLKLILQSSDNIKILSNLSSSF
jgi:hypothetical protein